MHSGASTGPKSQPSSLPFSGSSDNAQSQPESQKDAEVQATPTRPACVAKQAVALGIDAVPQIEGPAVYAGQPVQVLVFTRGNQAFVVAVADPDGACRLVDSQLLRTGK